VKLTILMPCLNEAETLAKCIAKARSWIERSGVEAEVVIADNGSTDGSQAIAVANGARVVDVPLKGYGSALYYGSMAAQGEYIVMGDSDDSYDFSRLDLFLEKLDQGYDLVMGNRFLGGIEPGAMPWKNRYIGNPVLTWIGRMLFKCPAKDFHCGLRGFRKSAFMKMDLRTTGMEFASEMVIKANLFKMRIAEVPTTLSKDGRSRPPHLRPWRDGWRHLRFMLLFSPKWLFVIPGLLAFFVSAFLYGLLLSGPVRAGSITLDVHTLFFVQAGLTLGFLAVVLGIIVQMFGVREGLLKDHSLLEKVRNSHILEIGGIVSLLLIAWGVYLGATLLMQWGAGGFGQFGQLEHGAFLRSVSLSTMLMTFGGISLLSSLIMGFIALPTRRQAVQPGAETFPPQRGNALSY
jgi:glycosyltransferase involved in cell wall biosynthesis